jgi:hypothetical protein
MKLGKKKNFRNQETWIGQRRLAAMEPVVLRFSPFAGGLMPKIS